MRTRPVQGQSVPTTAGAPPSVQEQGRVGPRLRVPLAVALLLAMVGMLANYLGMAPWVVVGQFAGDWFRGQSLGVQLFFGFLQSLSIALMALVVVWALMRWVCGRRPRQAGVLFTARSLPLLLLGVACACLVALPTMALLAQAGLDGDVEAYSGPTWAFVVNSLVLGFVMQGFPEEVVWRGYGLQLMERRPVLAVTVCSLLFGLLHLVSLRGGYTVGDRLAYLVWPAGFGFLAGALVVLTRSLWAAVGVHGGSHTADLLLTLNNVGAGQAVSWIVVGAVYFLAGGLVLLLWHRRGGGEIRYEH
ncbi:lysostaphin resistance A-like protein [Actinomycetota bacterium]